MINKIIIQPSSIAQWHALVNEAEQVSGISLHEDLESYLVFLLMRFITRPEMAASVLAMEFLNGLHATGEQRYDRLRELGDKCLLFSGLFPERANRRRINISYYINLGQCAYSMAAETYESSAKLFTSLSRDFEWLIAVLKATRNMQQIAPPVIDKKPDCLLNVNNRIFNIIDKNILH